MRGLYKFADAIHCLGMLRPKAPAGAAARDIPLSKGGSGAAASAASPRGNRPDSVAGSCKSAGHAPAAGGEAQDELRAMIRDLARTVQNLRDEVVQVRQDRSRTPGGSRKRGRSRGPDGHGRRGDKGRARGRSCDRSFTPRPWKTRQVSHQTGSKTIVKQLRIPENFVIFDRASPPQRANVTDHPADVADFEQVTPQDNRAGFKLRRSGRPRPRPEQPPRPQVAAEILARALAFVGFGV